jgi:hypothetical protein
VDLMTLLITGVKSKGMEDFMTSNDFTSERVGNSLVHEIYSANNFIFRVCTNGSQSSEMQSARYATTPSFR